MRRERGDGRWNSKQTKPNAVKQKTLPLFIHSAKCVHQTYFNYWPQAKNMHIYRLSCVSHTFENYIVSDHVVFIPGARSWENKRRTADNNNHNNSSNGISVKNSALTMSNSCNESSQETEQKLRPETFTDRLTVCMCVRAERWPQTQEGKMPANKTAYPVYIIAAVWPLCMCMSECVCVCVLQLNFFWVYVGSVAFFMCASFSRTQFFFLYFSLSWAIFPLWRCTRHGQEINGTCTLSTMGNLIGFRMQICVPHK